MIDPGTLSAVEAIAATVIMLTIGGIAVLLVWGLLRAGTLRPAVALVIALSLLTLVAMIGFIITQTSGEQSTELATLAGMGLGALAGAVTAVWGEDRAARPDPTPTHPPSNPSNPTPTDEWEAENPHTPESGT